MRRSVIGPFAPVLLLLILLFAPSVSLAQAKQAGAPMSPALSPELMATRAAIKVWGLETQCLDPRSTARSSIRQARWACTY